MTVVTITTPTQYTVEVVKLEQWQCDLLDAADWLENNEWCQGVVKAEDGARCAIGAVLICSQQHEALIALNRLSRFIDPRIYWDSVTAIMRFNDVAGRTKVEVINKIRECATQGV